MVQKVFRLRCGNRKHSYWLESNAELRRIAVAKGLASVDDKGRLFTGPLVWIEEGERSGRKTVPLPLPCTAPLHLVDRR